MIIAVVDIGKTNAKVALVDAGARAELAVLTRRNTVVPGPPYPHFDTDGLWAFVLDSLRQLSAVRAIAGVAITTHGACAALLTADGALAAPVLDYEHTGPDAARASYERLRPAFSETGSPPLPGGLNLGAQLHWQLLADATLRGRIATIVTWPQYWAFRLTGVAASDVCSLGCHTDLWQPRAGSFSSLVDRLGLSGVMAPPRRPGDVLGPILPDIAAATGLRPDTPVVCGIHDSNASLLPHLLDQRTPFTVVSTGTWVITMAAGGRKVQLDPARDTLENVDAFGRTVPSARFMGGRDYELMTQGRPLQASASPAAVTAVLTEGLMFKRRPGVVSGSDQPLQFSHSGRSLSDAEREVALGYYLALRTAECRTLIGAEGPSIVEGPLAQNRPFRAMLEAASGQPIVASASRTGTAIGAAMLFSLQPTGTDETAPVVATSSPPPEQPLSAYAQIWQEWQA